MSKGFSSWWSAALHALLCTVIAWPLASCTPDDEPATQIIVSVNSDLDVTEQLSRVRVEVRAFGGSAQSTPRTFNLTRVPFSFGITKGSANRILVSVTGFGPTNGSDAAVVERKETASFQDGKTLLLRIFLGETCLGNVCEGTETCQLDDTNGTPGQCAEVRDAPRVTPIEPGDEDDAWDEGASGAGGAGAGGDSGEGGAGAGGDSGAGGAGAGGAGAGGDSGQGGAGAGGDSGEGGAGAGGDSGEGGSGGSDCPDGSETTYHEDFDEDGYGDPNVTMTSCDGAPSGYVANADDCCDVDERAYPNALDYYATPVLCSSAVSYDFDCDGSETQLVTTIASGVCCDLSIGWENGWVGSVPACGEPGSAQVCLDEEDCSIETINDAQPCR